jgi:hypothetical protein
MRAVNRYAARTLTANVSSSPSIVSSRGPLDNGYDGGLERDPRRQLLWSVAESTPLVDRVHELDLIVRSLAAEGARLLTLVGPAGVGQDPFRRGRGCATDRA